MRSAIRKWGAPEDMGMDFAGSPRLKRLLSTASDHPTSLFTQNFAHYPIESIALFQKNPAFCIFVLAIVTCITETVILSMPVYVLKHILASIICLVPFSLFFYITWSQIKLKHPKGILISFILLMVSLLLAIPFCLYPSLDKYKNYKPYIVKLMKSVPRDSTVALYKPNETMCALFPFYLGIYPKDIETPQNAKTFLCRGRKRILAVFDRKGYLQEELKRVGLYPEEKVIIFKKRCLLLYACPGICRKLSNSIIDKLDIIVLRKKFGENMAFVSKNNLGYLEKRGIR